MSFCIVLVSVLGVVLATTTPPQDEYQPAQPAQPAQPTQLPTSPQPVLAQPALNTPNFGSLLPGESKPVVIVTAIAVDSSEDQAVESQPESHFESHLESQLEPQFESLFESQLESQLEPRFEPQFESLEPKFESIEPQFEYLLESQPESQQSSDESDLLNLESLHSETLKIITPSNLSTNTPQLTLPATTSPRPAPDSPPVVNKLVFKRITTPVPSTPVPSTPVPSTPVPSISIPSDHVVFDPSVESEIFGAKFFQPASTKPASTKPALAKSKPAFTSVKPSLSKPVFITKNASLKTSTYWPATEKPATEKPAPSQPASTEPSSPQFSLPQSTPQHISPPQLSSTQTSQPQPSPPHSSLLQQFQRHSQSSQPQSSPPHSSPLKQFQPHSEPSPQPPLPNSSPLQVQSYPIQSQHPSPSSPSHIYPHPYIHSTASSHSNSQNTPSLQSSVRGRQEDSIASNLVLSGFGKVKPAHYLQPNHVPSQSNPAQPNSDESMGFLVSLGPLTFLTSPSKASQSSPLVSEVEGRTGRSNETPLLSPASSKQHISRSHSFEQRRPVLKTQPRHILEEGDESRSISFSVNPPTPPATLPIITKSRGSPTSVSFNLPRSSPIRREVEKENHQNKKLLEKSRKVPQPNSASLHLSHPPAIPDTRTARRIHNAAPSLNLAPQEKSAAPVHPPHAAYQTKRPADYEFSYQVQGGYGGAPFGHQESREGPETRGSYVVPLPDGRVQRVTYYVSGNSGYRADVTYEGDAVYPHHSPRPAYRNEPTHQDPAPAQYSQPRQPARTYRSEPEQPARSYRSEPEQPTRTYRSGKTQPAPTFSSDSVHQPAQVPQQYASESQPQPAQSTRGYRSVPQPATSFVSGSMYSVNPAHQPAPQPAA